MGTDVCVCAFGKTYQRIWSKSVRKHHTFAILVVLVIVYLGIISGGHAQALVVITLGCSERGVDEGG